MNVELLFIINLSVLINHSNEKHTRKKEPCFHCYFLDEKNLPKRMDKRKRVFVTVLSRCSS